MLEDLPEDLLEVAREDFPELAFEDLPVAFFVVLPLAECLPFTLLCVPEDARDPVDPALCARAGGTGSFQLNASIWAPT